MASCQIAARRQATGDIAPALASAPDERCGRRLMDIDLRWVNGVMAFLAAANFVVSAIHTVLLFAG